jgi:small subunit ribosomal protein S11
MPRNAVTRLFTGSICTSCRSRIRHAQAPTLAKALSTTPSRLAEPQERTQRSRPPGKSASTSGLSDLFHTVKNSGTADGPSPPNLSGVVADLMGAPSRGSAFSRTAGLSNLIPDGNLQSTSSDGRYGSIQGPPAEPHHFHIYCTKHNTHICLTRPNREPILSFSSGNIGFRKAQRGSYDAAFQLAAYVMKMIQDRGLLRSTSMISSGADGETTTKGKGVEPPIGTLEFVIRGFGKGREAVVKALLGNEGRLLRNKVVKISDATRLKFGGTRSPNPRRLG